MPVSNLEGYAFWVDLRFISLTYRSMGVDAVRRCVYDPIICFELVNVLELVAESGDVPRTTVKFGP